MPWSMSNSLGKKYAKKHKMEKATLGFRIYKIWQILKRFAGTFCQAQTLKLGGVYYFPFLSRTLTMLVQYNRHF